DAKPQHVAAHTVEHAVARAGIANTDVEDVILGCALQQGASGGNIARQAAARAGMPDVVPGMTIDRQCSSGLMAVATAAKQILHDGMTSVIAGGVESISLVQNDHLNLHRAKDPWLVEHHPDTYMSMLETAEIVAARYEVSRARQDEFAALSQQRTAEAQHAGRFATEIVPFTTTRKVLDKSTGETRDEEVTVTEDEGNRPGTTRADLEGLRPVMPDGSVTPESVVTAGNSSQLSDGAAALVLLERAEAQRRGLDALGAYRGMAVVGCPPAEMGIGPVRAVPELLRRHDLQVADIGLWELNEAFASQAVYCRDELGIDPDSCNVNGGAISVGHPYGMTGARLEGHELPEGERGGIRYVVVTMCVG